MASVVCDSRSVRQDAVLPVGSDEELRVLTALVGCLMVADAGAALEGHAHLRLMPQLAPQAGQGGEKAV